MKFESREVEHPRFSSKAKGKSYGSSGMTVSLYGQYGYYLINSKQNGWNIAMKENDLR